jgi:hypothetical protein
VEKAADQRLSWADGVAAGWTGPARSNNYRFAVVRYMPAGGLDATFAGDGTVSTNFTTGNDFAWDMAIQADGKVLSVGRAEGAGGMFALVRYSAAWMGLLTSIWRRDTGAT